MGVIRPTTELAGKFTKTKHVGVLGTTGTIQSDSYKIEIEKFFPDVKIFQQACPMWVPLAENNELNSPATDIFVKQYLKELFSKSKRIDTIILGCTHYPLLLNKIKKYSPKGIKIISQGNIVADGLADYLKRHPEMEKKISKNNSVEFFTTDSPEGFDKLATVFFGKKVMSKYLAL